MTVNDSKFSCVVCGKMLHETAGETLQCTYCGQREKSDFTCENNHYVCEPCRICTPTEIIHKTCLACPLDDPLSLANLLMHHPAFPMFGPEHHLLVPAILLTVAHNAGHEVALDSLLRRSMKRAARFGLGSCASMGVCGAAVGVAIAVSLLIGADYTKPKERKTVLQASASALTAMTSLPAPRCCKASVYSSLSVGTAYLRREMGLSIPSFSCPTCQFQEHNAECMRNECPFFEPSSCGSSEGSRQ
jgi:hypothetical protein